MSKITTTSRPFKPFEIETISGVDVDQQRDWKRRGFYAARTGDIMEAARFFLVEILRGSGFDLPQAWAVASDEVVGWIVFHAAQHPGALQDNSKQGILRANPSFRNKAAMDLTGRRAVAAGPLLIWGPDLEPALFPEYEMAHREVNKTVDGPSLLHVLDLRHLPTMLYEETGIFAYIEEVA